MAANLTNHERVLVVESWPPRRRRRSSWIMAGSCDGLGGGRPAFLAVRIWRRRTRSIAQVSKSSEEEEEEEEVVRSRRWQAFCIRREISVKVAFVKRRWEGVSWTRRVGMNWTTERLLGRGGLVSGG